MKSKIIYTRYEKARIIGARALQLAMGAPVLIDIDEKKLKKINYSVIELAKEEFEEGVLPITVKRPLPPKTHEGSINKNLES